MRLFGLHFLVLFQLLPFTFSFTDYLLKKCDQASFCQRNRYLAENIDPNDKNDLVYSIDSESIVFNNDTLYANIIKTIPRKDIEDIKIVLPLKLYFIGELNAIRFSIDEIRHNCHITHVDCQRFNQTWDWAVSDNYKTDSNTKINYKFSSRGNNWFSRNKSQYLNIFNDKIKIDIQLNKFQMNIYYKNELKLIINEKNFFNIEHFRSKTANFQNVLPFESTFNMFADNFQYSKDDTMPLGPESIGMDFTFKGFDNVYGIPEHADSLKLKDTTNTEPYRLFNVDVFEYNVNSRQPMYGAIPLMIASKPGSSMGLFWVNAADTWIDIKYDQENHETMTHWMSENGIVDTVLFFGEAPNDITSAYTDLTGKPALPLLSTIGYHQCRWNYNNELDVLNVEESMDANHIPFDVIWLDLEYTDSKKYFTWNHDAFPNPKRLLEKLSQLGRQLVILIDPHIKNNYDISKIIKKQSAELKNNRGDSFLGECWPGTSIWIDTIGSLGKKLWSNLFESFMEKYLSSGANNLHFWNDMNEPSVFSGPETTAPKDVIHDGYLEERSIHNIYGLSVHESTYQSMKNIYGNLTRPFLLTRSFFAGSQRTVAAWTGDNVATWEYLKISVPMVLTNNIAGFPFIGADIAGFSGNPESELFVRWYQTGVWYPFFRAHAHIDSKRREPYLFKEPIKSIVRDTIRLRYKLLPTFYTAFYESSVSGSPVMMPMFYMKDQFNELYDIDDQFYLGNSGIVVKPIVSKGVDETTILLAPGIYYDLETLAPTSVEGKSVQEIEVSAPLSKIPAFIEGGHIVTRRDRHRRSSKLMKMDPYTLVVARDKNDFAQGKLYVDDGESYEYQNGEYIETTFTFAARVLKNEVIHKPATPHNDEGKEEVENIGNRLIEKIVIPLNDISSTEFKEVATVKQGTNERLIQLIVTDTEVVIKNPFVKIDEEWELIF